MSMADSVDPGMSLVYLTVNGEAGRIYSMITHNNFSVFVYQN